MAGPNIGFATLSVIPSARGFKQALGGAVGPAVDDVGKESGGRFGNAFAAASKVALAGGAAAIGIGIKGLMDFSGFERQMNEVFTLLPDLSAEAMGQMQKDVKGFASEFGVLPNEVIPALYQSISAGVPTDNVFSFLETAQMAAKGGVTELTTAVDGISSVVNAYGSEVISATEASDLMFTAVKLGKTDFEQLSSSLFNVTPTASGLGVAFEDITAALATMTAQGVPTSVATTQLRQLFVELSKEGSAAADVFKSMSGKTFSDFVRSGGNTAEALELMQEAAKDGGVAIQDLFGSVEAGSAALTLAGNESFTNALDAMAESAGATETAFNQMEQGLGPVMDKIKARLAVASISIGEWLAPKIEAAIEVLGQWWERNGPQIQAVMEAVGGALVIAGEAIGRFTLTVLDGLSSWWDDHGETVTNGLKTVGEVIGTAVTEGFQFLSNWWDTNGATVVAGIRAIGDVINDPVLPAMGALVAFIKDEILPKFVELFELIKGNDFVLRVMLVTAIGAVAVGFGAWAINAGLAAGATIIAFGAAILAWLPFVLLGLAASALAIYLYDSYQNAGWFYDVVNGGLAYIEAMSAALEVLVGWLDDLIEVLSNVKDQFDITKPAFGLLPGASGKFDITKPGFGLFEFDTGGIVPGYRGEPQLALVHGGETILPTHKQDFSLSGSGSSAPVVAGDYIVQVMPGEDALRRGPRELRKLQYLGGR